MSSGSNHSTPMGSEPSTAKVALWGIGVLMFSSLISFQQFGSTPAVLIVYVRVADIAAVARLMVV